MGRSEFSRAERDPGSVRPTRLTWDPRSRSGPLAPMIPMLGCALVLAGCLGSTTGTTPAPRGVDAHRWTAELDARSLLATYRPPPGSIRLATAPKGPLIDKPPTSQATPELIDLTHVWRTPGEMAGVMAYVKAHVPAHWADVGSAEAGKGPTGPRTGAQAHTITDVQLMYDTFSLPTKGPALQSRQVLVSVAPSGKHEVVLRVDVQDVWVPVRPAWSYVSNAVTSVRLSVFPGSGHHTVTSTNPAVVETFRRLVNAMPAAATQGWYSCPADTGQGYRLTFKGPGAATIRFWNDAPGCNVPVVVQVAGHAVMGLSDTGGRLYLLTQVPPRGI